MSQDETVIRNMVNQAIDRPNKGDVTTIADFWDEHADYVGADGELTEGKAQFRRSLAGWQNPVSDNKRY
jgi:ketosteroid isomerase-like protein